MWVSHTARSYAACRLWSHYTHWGGSERWGEFVSYHYGLSECVRLTAKVFCAFLFVLLLPERKKRTFIRRWIFTECVKRRGDSSSFCHGFQKNIHCFSPNRCSYWSVKRLNTVTNRNVQTQSASEKRLQSKFFSVHLSQKKTKNFNCYFLTKHLRWFTCAATLLPD